MLSSIHPLGERARNNRWGVTVAAFTLASIGAAAAVGATLGFLGSLLLGGPSASTIFAMALVAALAATLDVTGPQPPGPKRQVNEHWIGYYRGWVYGGLFGLQLGSGLTTFVVTWTVYAVLVAQFMLASPLVAALVGAVFGFGRAVPLLATWRIRKPGDLTAFHHVLQRLGPPMRRSTSLVVGSAGLLLAIGTML